jgi:hypothetical protein
MVLSISKLWNSLKPSQKLALLNSIGISAERIDIRPFEEQYPSFQKALKSKSNLIRAWYKGNKKQPSKIPIKSNEKLLKTGTYTIS